MVIQNSFNNTLTAGVKFALGGDATGDLHYTAADGKIARLPIGTNGFNLTIVGGLPAWVSGSSPGGAAGGDLTGTYPNPTIAGSAVSFAKMQNIATAQLLGRSTAGTGAIETLSAATARTLLALGTAALVNTGTTNGTIPLLDVNGQIASTMIPALRSHEFVEVATQAARLALTTTQVQPGDEAYQTDTLETYKLIATDPSLTASWRLVSDLTLPASAITSGIIATDRLATGTADATKYFRGDQTWQPLPFTPLPVTEITGTSQTAAANNTYEANNAGLVTITLPATAAKGSIIQIVGVGAGGWRVAQLAGQVVYFGDQSTTVGNTGRLDSTHRRDTVTLYCNVANTEWTVIGSNGNINVVNGS